MILYINETPILKSLEINDCLTIKNDGNSYNLRSYLIYVRKRQLTLDTEEEPLEKNVTVTLYGDRADKDVYFNGKMFGGGNKGIAVTGTLKMFGKPVATKWTRLAL